MEVEKFAHLLLFTDFVSSDLFLVCRLLFQGAFDTCFGNNRQQIICRKHTREQVFSLRNTVAEESFGWPSAKLSNVQTIDNKQLDSLS